jgi:hypothetical protein
MSAKIACPASREVPSMNLVIAAFPGFQTIVLIYYYVIAVNAERDMLRA